MVVAGLKVGLLEEESHIAAVPYRTVHCNPIMSVCLHQQMGFHLKRIFTLDLHSTSYTSIMNRPNRSGAHEKGGHKAGILRYKIYWSLLFLNKSPNSSWIDARNIKH